jgi:polar amino acid transport system permease protein
VSHVVGEDVASGGTTAKGVGRTRPPRGSGEPRLSFRVKVAIVWVVIFVLIGAFVSLAKFDWTWMRENALYISKGLWVTLFVAALSIVLAIVLALLGSLGRLSRNSIAYGVSGFYTSFFRGTPLIVQLFLVYFAIPQVAVGLGLQLSHPDLYRLSVLSPIATGVLVLGLNYGAYMTEIFRAGILSVGHGQAEAADALGMTYSQRMRRVVLPQAFKVVVPPTANEFIAMTKDTALILFLGGPLFWYDTFTRARTLGTLDTRPLEALIVAAGLYWILTIILTFFQSKLERRLNRAYIRQAESAVTTRKTRWLSGTPSGPAGGGAQMVQVPEPEAGAGEEGGP